MKKNKLLGIYMDHSNAVAMELADDRIITNNVVSEAGHPEKDFNLYKSEKLIHKKEQHLQSGYYKQLGGIIKGFNEVIIFGPTDAKTELFNLIKTDHQFENIKIEILNSDKLTEPQMHTFIREYFK